MLKHYHKELELIEGWLDRASALLGDDEDGDRKEGKERFFCRCRAKETEGSFISIDESLFPRRIGRLSTSVKITFTVRW